MELLLDSVRRSAARAGWSEIYFNATSKVVSFKKASYSARINVYYSTGTVGTCIDHPRQGKTQLFRRNVDLVMLNTIFDDPRVHTDRGYQRNRNNPPPRRSEAHPAAISQAWGEGGGQLGGGGGGGGEPALRRWKLHLQPGTYYNIRSSASFNAHNIIGEFENNGEIIWASEVGTSWLKLAYCNRFVLKMSSGANPSFWKEVSSPSDAPTPMSHSQQFLQYVPGSKEFGVAIRTSPAYPGHRTENRVGYGEIHEFAAKQVVPHTTAEGLQVDILFYELADGRGWVHDFDPQAGFGKRTIVVLRDEVGGEENEVLKYLASLNTQKAALDTQRAALDKKIAEVQAFAGVYERHRAEEAAAEAERQRAAAAAEAERQRAEEKKKRKENRGTTYCYRLLPNSTKMMDGNFTSDCSCIALSGDEDVAIMLFDRGTWAYTAGLPTALYNKLHTRAVSHPSPTVVSLGSQGRYYIRFENGKSEWAGPESLSETIKEDLSRTPVSVAFGESWGAYFVVFQDGGWAYRGEIPTGLRNALTSNKDKSIEFGSLGPNGEYFLRAKSGRIWLGGCSTEFNRRITGGTRKKLCRVHFGDNEAYICRYND